MSLTIDYESAGFPKGAPVANGHGTLAVTWDDLLWAAITVGRPNRHYVFKYGRASRYEALFRWSMMRMALEQSGPRARRLRRTELARRLDPTEKGAVNYFLGLAIAKLMADRLLDAPWMLHLDVFGSKLSAVLKGRSRPDLVGETLAGEGIALECKGRLSVPYKKAKDKAKAQAQRIVSIRGYPPKYQIGAITYFKKDVLKFYWQDPEVDPNIKNAIKVEFESEDVWRHYYQPILDLVQANASYLARMREEECLMPVPHADVQIGIRPRVLNRLLDAKWADARKSVRGSDNSSSIIGYRTDGIAVIAGESWKLPFEGDQGSDG